MKKHNSSIRERLLSPRKPSKSGTWIAACSVLAMLAMTVTERDIIQELRWIKVLLTFPFYVFGVIFFAEIGSLCYERFTGTSTNDSSPKSLPLWEHIRFWVVFFAIIGILLFYLGGAFADPKPLSQYEQGYEDARQEFLPKVEYYGEIVDAEELIQYYSNLCEYYGLPEYDPNE